MSECVDPSATWESPCTPQKEEDVYKAVNQNVPSNLSVKKQLRCDAEMLITTLFILEDLECGPVSPSENNTSAQDGAF